VHILDKSREEELSQIKSKIIKINIIGYPGLILLGLGFYGLFGAKGDAFHPMLNDMKVVYGFIAYGIASVIWEFTQLIPLYRKKEKINNEKNT